MATDFENARVTELLVRMDCNGCVQRITKAIHRIDGVYNVSVDIPQQKLTVVGRADPETLVRAIRKTRKTAIVSSHAEPGAPLPPTETPPAEADPAAEVVLANDPPPQEHPPPDESKPSPEAQETVPADSQNAEETRNVVHEYPHDDGIGEQWNSHPPTMHEAPLYVTHSRNTYSPSSYATEYGYLRSPPQDARYDGMETYNGGGYYQNHGREAYHRSCGNDGNHINSMFSDENPNACRIA